MKHIVNCACCGKVEYMANCVKFDDEMFCGDCYAASDVIDNDCDDDIDHWGYNDVSPDQLAGEIFSDRLSMYRNEY